MRILHVVEATIAGVRTHVQALATGLDARRFQSVVACPPRREHSFGDEQFVAFLAQAGIPVLPVPMRRSIDPAADIAALRRLVSILRRERFDVVHLHSSKAGFLGRLAARLTGGAAVVYTPNGLSFLGDYGRAQRQIYTTLERIAGRWCDCVIAVSAGERELIIQAGLVPPDRVVCIENGVAPISLPPGYDRAALRNELGQPGAAPLIGTVARLAAQKNPFLFLDAAARVVRELPEARFVWCGGGELAAQAQQYAAALGIAGVCSFVGHRDDAQQIMAALDVFWLTSNFEGLPIALLEALALRLPVVATDVLGTRDLLGGVAGLLVPHRDPEALARATLGLARSPERRAQLARAGYARFLERGTAERMLRSTESLYERLVAGRTRRAAAPALAGKNTLG
jgi:glycosyltransferase involved in cell wall biosynthesis